MSFGEFSCPICKTYSNGIIPEVGFQEIKDSELGKVREYLDFFMDFLSKIITVQRGQEPAAIIRGEKPSQSAILPTDVYHNTEEVLNSIVNFATHKIFLVDLKGIATFKKSDKDFT